MVRDYSYLVHLLVPAVISSLSGCDLKTISDIYEIITAEIPVKRPENVRTPIPLERVYSHQLPRANLHKLYGSSRRVTSS